VDLRLPESEASGFANAAGVKIAWQSFGRGESAVLVVPTWNFVDSRVSARLVPELSRSFRVITFDPRGAGRSDRPPTGYLRDDHVADAVAVLEATGVARASMVGGSAGANTAALLAARLPDKVDRLVLIDPPIRVGTDEPPKDDSDDEFWRERASYEGWQRWSAPYWRQDWPGFARWFLELVFNEPGSEEVIDAVLSVALEADPEVLIQQQREQQRRRNPFASGILGTISSPTLVVHGELDQSAPLALGRAVAAAIPGAVLAVVVGGCHRPDIRSPELINPLLVDFLRDQQLTDRPGIEILQ